MYIYHHRSVQEDQPWIKIQIAKEAIKNFLFLRLTMCKRSKNIIKVHRIHLHLHTCKN